MVFSTLKDKVKVAFTAGSQEKSVSFDVSDAKDYVSTMTQVIQSTSEQQHMAMQKVAHLSKSLENMETQLARLSSVEAENKNLSAKAAKLASDFSGASTQANELDTQLSVTKRQLKLAQDELVTLRSDMSKKQDLSSKSETFLAEQKKRVSTLSAKISGLEQRKSDMTKRNRTLEEDLSKARGEVALHRRSASEFTQKLEELERSGSQTRESYQASVIELNALKKRYAEVNENHIDTQARLETAKFEARSLQTQHSDSLRRREEENLSLKNRISHLETQLRIKENANTQAEREIIEAQHSLRLANMRADQAENLSREVSLEAQASASNVISSQSDYDALNAKFVTAMDDIATLKKLNEIQKSKLMQYAAVESSPVPETPVKSKPAALVKAQKEPQAEPAKNIRILRQVRPAS